MPKKKITPLNEDFDLKLFAIIAKKNFVWMVAFLFLSLTIAYLYLRYNPPVYEAGAIIKLSNENKAATILGERKDIFFDDNSKMIAGDVELIRSKIITEMAVRKLPLGISYYAKGTVLENELYKSSPFTVEAIITDSSVYGLPFYVKFEDQANFTLSFHVGAKKKISQRYKINDWITLPSAKFRINITDYENILDHQTAIKQDAYYFVLNRSSDEADKIVRSLIVGVANPDAKTIYVKIKDHNARKAADLVNQIASEFIEYDVDKSKEVTDKVIEFLSQTINSVDDSLSNSEQRLENFRKTNKVMDPNLLVNDVFNKINKFKDDKLNLELQITLLDQVKKNISDNKPIDDFLLSIVGKYDQGNIAVAINALQTLINDRDQILVQATDKAEITK